MTKFYCDGCGDELVNYHHRISEEKPLEEDFRFMAGIFCPNCMAKGIVLKDEFIKESYELHEKYIKRLKTV